MCTARLLTVDHRPPPSPGPRGTHPWTQRYTVSDLEADTLPPVDRQTSVKTLPCPKLHLRMVITQQECLPALCHATP